MAGADSSLPWFIPAAPLINGPVRGSIGNPGSPINGQIHLYWRKAKQLVHGLAGRQGQTIITLEWDLLVEAEGRTTIHADLL